MRKLINIRLKDEPKARMKVILGFKDHFGLGIVEGRDLCDAILAKGEVICSDDFCYDLIPRENRYKVEDAIQRLFVCEFINETLTSYEPYVRVTPPEVVEALAWRDTLSEKEQEMIKLIGDWEHPVVIAGCGASTQPLGVDDNWRD